MKKAITLLCLVFCLTASLLAQNIQCDYEVRYTRDVSGVTADISISIKSGEPAFTFYLMTNDPIHGTVLIKSEPIGKRKYTFTGVKPGKYFIKIEDGTGAQTGKTVTVNESEN